MPTANELYQQAKVAGNVSFAAEWGRTQTQLAKMSAGERASQLGNASLEVGEFVMARDAQGQARMRIGHQSDGTVAVVYGNGPPPPVPTAPVVSARQLAIYVGWDGLFAGGYARPGDLRRVDVHRSTTQNFTPDGTTIVGRIDSEGGILIGADNVTHYIKMVAVTTSDVASAPTAEIAVLPLPASQIAAGAIGAQQLAADIAFVSRLVAGNPGGAHLELEGRDGMPPGLALYDQNLSSTLKLDAATGDISIRGEIRTADAGERLVLREDPNVNDMRFYPPSGDNYARLFSREFAVDGANFYGLSMAGPVSDSGDRRSHFWVTDGNIQVYRGSLGGSLNYGGLFLSDAFSALVYNTVGSSNITSAATGRVLLRSISSALEFGSTRNTGVDASGVFANHDQKLAVWALGGFTWRFNFANQSGIGQVPLFWVAPQNCGMQLRSTGIDVYNPVTGSYLAVGASQFVVNSARASKTEIEDLPFDAERVIVDASVSMYEYVADQRDGRGRYRKAGKRFGPMADDLPALLQVPAGQDPDGIGIDLARNLAVVWAATGNQTRRLGEHADRLAALDARLAALEGAA